MEQLIEIGILQQSDEQDNLYEKILARIAKSDVSSAVLSVKVVHALSNLVFVVKNRWKDKVPTSKLTKKQFVHILAYICDRNSTLEEQDKMRMRNIWNPKIMQDQMDSKPHALWPGLKYLGVDIASIEHRVEIGNKEKEAVEEITSEETCCASGTPGMLVSQYHFILCSCCSKY